ncbi:RHS repeat-associated core domain-containing protein, partial [Enterobacter sichuanensis]
ARVDHLRDQRSGEIYWFNTDLNGAPLEVTDERGAVRWSGQYGSFGEVRHQSEGFSRLVNRSAMAHQPLRYAGQYADGETGLHYNLFRYYDPQVGRFIVQDPIGLNGGWNLYQYAPNPLLWIDPLGLTALDTTGYNVYGLFDPGATKPYYVGITDDLLRRAGEHRDSGRLTPGAQLLPLDENVTYAQARGYEQYYIEEYKTRTGTIGEDISATNRGNKYNSFDHKRTDGRGQAFEAEYSIKKNGSGGKGKRCG